MNLRVAHREPCTEAEGPGRRYALWLQGCPLRCPGCCNPEYLPMAGGTLAAVGDLVAEVQAAAAEWGVEGITLLGGEPTAQAAGAAVLAEAMQRLGLSVMLFSGFTLEELRARQDEHIRRLLQHTDLLVDGPYDRERPDHVRRWIGSTNQAVHFLTERYRRDDPCWAMPNTLELRLTRGELRVNGFPAAAAREFQRQLRGRP